MNILKRTSYYMGLGAAIFLSVPGLHADDTEVYLQGIPAGSSNNIMMMIDTAGAGNSGDIIENIAAALNRVIDRTASSTNMGLSRYYAGGQPGGSYVAYPVTPLLNTAGTQLTSLAITGDGDAYQASSSDAIVIGDPEVKVAGGDGSTRPGFVFNPVAVPRHASITNAYIELHSSFPVSGAEVSLLQNDVDLAQPFSASNNLFAAGWKESVITKVTGPDNRTYNTGAEWDTKVEKVDTYTIRIPLTPVMQDMVSRAAWCGNETIGLGFMRSDSTFTYYASEANGQLLPDGVTPVKAPSLHVEWDPTSMVVGDGLSGDDALSCMGGEHRDPSQTDNDAIELLSGGTLFSDRPFLVGDAGNLDTVSTSKKATKPNGSKEAVSSGSYMAALRMPQFGLQSGDVISNARLYLNAMEVSGDGKLVIDAINGDALPFDSDGSISAQGTLGASVEYPLTAGQQGYFEVDVTDMVNKVLATAGWTAGSNLGFVLKSSAPDSFSVRLGGMDDGVASAAYMKFDALAASTSSFLPSSRDALKEQVALLASAQGGGKPDTATSLLDMGSYMHGHVPITGADYYKTNEGSEPADTYADDIFDARYSSYRLPPSAADQCSRSHIIMMAGKSPNDRKTAQDNVSKATEGVVKGSDPDCPGTDDYTCSATYAKWLANPVDPADRVPVVTHIVGFQLKDTETEGYSRIAEASGGFYVPASNVDEVETAFSEIIDRITVENASLAAPGVAVNQLNRFQHLDQLYYSVFKPDFLTQWKGNLKRYRLEFASSGPRIVDATGAVATDDTTGFFKDESKSFWSDSVDGNLAVMGGARGEIDNGSTTRKLYYFAGTESNLEPSGSIDATSFGSGQALTLMDDTNQPTAAQMNLADAADQPEAVTFLKFSWGDPLHSEPRLVTYDVDTVNNTQDNVVYVGTNDGILHAVDADDGSERFSFIPPDELAKTGARMENEKLLPTDYPRSTYGLDATWTPWRRVEGSNLNVYMFGGQRRGGRNMYALDVTDADATPDPRLLWRIKGGSTSGFDDLGQTWSSPTLAQIKINGKAVPVLIFGGGYDSASHDTAGTSSSGDSMGNAIYMVNAVNGKLIWSASDASSNSGAASHDTVSNMKWSIPSDVAAVDLDVDGFIDALYATDLGGQIFRVDLNMDNTGAGSLVRRVETLASLGYAESSSYSDHRRLYASVTASLAYDSSDNPFLQVVVGSGYRAHPLEKNATQDRIFMVEDTDIFNAQKTGYTSSGTVGTSDLVDVTSNLSPSAGDLSKRGWYLNLDKANGEKVLDAAAILDGVIYLTAYVPTDLSSRSDCAPVQGRTRLYTINVNDASPAGDANNDGAVDGSDRIEESALIGLGGGATVVVGGEDPPTDPDQTDDDGYDSACESGSQIAILVGTSVRSGGFMKGCGLKKTRWYPVDSDAEADAVIQAENPNPTTP